MKYLLYCILEKPPAIQGPENIPGIEGEPVALITKSGLSAAVSKISGADLAPELDKLLAYGKVIESFHRNYAVIPMRFGCLLENRPQLAGLLERNSLKYKRLLQELEGCAEMGIRFLPPGERPGLVPQPRSDPLSVNSKANPAGRDPSDPSGRAYLVRRKTHYDLEDKSIKRIEDVIHSCRKVFAGLYLQCKTETRSAFAPPRTLRPPLFSLYFLVSKNCVEPFRQVFRETCAKGSGELLLTGPWPPYNFAMLDETPKDHNLLSNESH